MTPLNDAAPALRSAPPRAAIAQLVEHLIRNEGVGGSNPSCGTTNFSFSNWLLYSTFGAAVLKWKQPPLFVEFIEGLPYPGPVSVVNVVVSDYPTAGAY